MTKSDPKSKIIDLGKRAEAGTSRKLGELLSQCESKTIEISGKGLQSLFERVDDSLFDMAERADSNQVQTQYFDGMREIRRQRSKVESEFRRQISRGFREFANGHSAVPEEFDQPENADGLSLVENDELEESLAVANMVSRSEARLQSALHALNARFGMVRGGEKCQSDENPVGAHALTFAFKKGAKHWDIEIRVRLLIFKLFEKHVLSQLPKLYEALNEQLAKAGVLPHLKFSIPRPRIQGGGVPGAPVAPGAAAPPGDEMVEEYVNLEQAGVQGGPMDPDMALEQQLFATMQSLLQSRRSHGRPSSGGMVRNVQAYQHNDVLNALSALQHEVQHGSYDVPMGGGEQAGGEQLGAYQGYRPVHKEKLLNQIQRVSGRDEGALATRDEDAIDLVSMLFEYILEDTNLPSAIQALLARLQIPYLKVAVLDRHLFAKKSHPARRLLDALARAGIGWTEDSDKNEQLIGKIRETVDRVLKEFKDDLGLFDDLLNEFDRFQERTQRRSKVAEKRTTEATRGRERLLEARRQAAQEVLARIGEKPLPEVVRYLLTRPWANVLVLILLRQGDESKEWSDALKLIDELLWSCEPKGDEKAITQLKRRLPWLERQIRLGLRLVAMHEDDIDRQIEEIARVHQRVVNGQPAIQDRPEPAVDSDGQDDEVFNIDDDAEDAAAATDRGEIDARQEDEQGATEADATAEPALAPEPDFAPSGGGGDRFVEEIILESGASHEPEKAETVDDDFTQQTRDLKVGTWVEFTAPDEEIIRAKLSWISPITQNYLFVNRNGIKVLDKSLSALAIEFRRGSARVLEDVPLFDRALDAIVSRLKKDQPKDAADGNEATPE